MALTLRSAGQYNESFLLGFAFEGSRFKPGSDLTADRQADLRFNEVALCISEGLKHADANAGTTDKLTRDEVCKCTKAVGAKDRATIAEKPSRSPVSKTGFDKCPPCPTKIKKPEKLRIPPIDL